ncbi:MULTISPECIES: bifunctional DNA primase/polymerase [unclassified Pseudonocardia]|uniref:bifunctional DNA primase/polymerase n=1 Tax=unclassified Pseudonocardia TaxID=2619320 RepID=UPI001D042EA4|nr:MULTISPECIES: bifunctional DNA primase/polymerase [unclassified Pseudonocardia]
MPRRVRPRLDREVMRLRQVALDAAAAGLFVFPVKAGSKIPAFHGETQCRGRGPCAGGHQGWEQRATRDPAQIRRWWSHTSSRWNVGVACGPSGLVVIDLDTRTEPLPEWDGATTGREVLDQLAAQHGEILPDTYSTVTPTDGEHLYYRMPEGLALRNTHGGHGHSLGPLIDTRAGGGFVVGAGSIRPEGAYLVAEHGQIAELPAWLATLLTPPPPRPRRTTPLVLSAKDANALMAKILREETDHVTRAPQGQRQFTLLTAARVLGQWVGGGELDADNAYAVLLDAATAHIGVAGFTRAEAERTVTRGMSFGMRAPRTVTRGRSAGNDTGEE